jgi:hypothetical protein
MGVHAVSDRVPSGGCASLAHLPAKASRPPSRCLTHYRRSQYDRKVGMLRAAGRTADCTGVRLRMLYHCLRQPWRRWCPSGRPADVTTWPGVHARKERKADGRVINLATRETAPAYRALSCRPKSRVACSQAPGPAPLQAPLPPTRAARPFADNQKHTFQMTADSRHLQVVGCF